MIKQKFLKVNGADLHYLDTGAKGSGLPFVYVPGISGRAEEALPIIEGLSERRCIAISMRGRGLSSTPDDGYSIHDHGLDLEAVMAALELKKGLYHLHGYSIGVMYCLAFLANTNVPPASFIIGDHPGQVKKLPEGWALQFAQISVRGKLVTENIRLEALKSIEKSSGEVSYYGTEAIGDRLSSLPSLLLRGSKDFSPSSPLNDADEDALRQIFPHLITMKFSDAGHFLRDTHQARYLSAVREFLKKHDS